MPPAVRRIFDRECGITDSVGSGMRALAKYRVQTRDEFSALAAPGVPQMGDTYSVARPNLVVTSLRTVIEGGKDDANGVGGVTTVFVEYTERNYQWSGEVKEVQPPGVKHTIITIANESVEIGAGIDPATNLPKQNVAVINNGKGASKQVGRIQAEVYDFRALTYNVPYATLIGLASDKALNSDAITLPAPLGTTTTIALAAKQALYMGFTVEARPDAILVKHQLELATSFQFIWPVPDKDGNVIAYGSEQLYRAVAFSGLW